MDKDDTFEFDRGDTTGEEGTATADAGNTGAGPSQANPFEAGLPVEVEATPQGASNATGRRSSRPTTKRKRPEEINQREALTVYDEVDQKLERALVILEDTLLPGPREMISDERLAKLEETHRKLKTSLSKIAKTRKEQRISKENPKFDKMWISRLDHDAFLSSQETEGRQSQQPSSDFDSQEFVKDAYDGFDHVFSEDMDTEEMVAQLSQEPSNTRKPAGRRPTNLHLLKSEAQLIARVKPVRDFVSEFCKEQSELEGPEVSPSQLYGRLLHLENYNTTKDADGTVISPANRDMAAVGMRIWNGEEVNPLPTVELKEAAYIQEVHKVPTTAYCGIKHMLYKKIKFPAVSSKLAPYKMKMRPELYNDVLAEGEKRGFMGGPRYKLDSALIHTIAERLLVEKEAGKSFSNNIEFKMAMGYDGCSSHSKYLMSEDTKSMLLGSYIVPELKDKENGAVIWSCREDGGFNSIYNTRPLCIIPKPETPELIDALLNGIKDVPGVERGPDADIPGVESGDNQVFNQLGEIQAIMANGLTFTLDDEESTLIHATMPELPDPIGDGKMGTICTGLGGGYCVCCPFSPADCKCRALIIAGFPISRTRERCMQLFEEKAKNRTTGDYMEREGQTQPVISRLNWFHHLAIMHSKIHVLRFLCELLYRIMAHSSGGVDYWFSAFDPLCRCEGGQHIKGSKCKNYTTHEKEHIAAAKEKVKEHAKTHINIWVFSASFMETGNMFEKFSLDTSREVMAKLIIDDDVEEQDRKREAWKSIHLDLCALAVVGNSQKTKVNVDLYKELSTKVYLRIVDEFPWAQIKESIHELMAHAGQLIEENDHYGLGNHAEHGLERGQQEFKGWRLRGSRKTNRYDNLKDSINHMTQASSPLLRPLDKRRKKRQGTKKAINNKRTGLTELVNGLFVGGVAPREAFEFSIHPIPEG